MRCCDQGGFRLGSRCRAQRCGGRRGQSEEVEIPVIDSWGGPAEEADSKRIYLRCVDEVRPGCGGVGLTRWGRLRLSANEMDELPPSVRTSTHARFSLWRCLFRPVLRSIGQQSTKQARRNYVLSLLLMLFAKLTLITGVAKSLIKTAWWNTLSSWRGGTSTFEKVNHCSMDRMEAGCVHNAEGDPACMIVT
jgi:hypothetical protein